MERICLGFPFHTERNLEPEEKEHLRQVAQSWLRKGLWNVIGPIPIVGMLPLLAFLLPYRFLQAVGFSFVWISFFVLLSAAWSYCVLRGFRSFRRYRSLRQALEEGVVYRFEGTLGTLAHLDWGHYKLAQLGLLQYQPNLVQSLEILPHCNVLFQCNSEKPSSWARFHIAEVASQPQSTFRVPLSTIIPTAQTEAPHLERRHLHPEERHELEQHIRSMFRPFGLVSGLLLLLLGALGSQIWMLTTQPKTSSFHLGFVTVLGVASLILGGKVWQVFRELQNMRHDLRVGWVICIPQEPKRRYLSAESSASLEEQLVEVLPISTTLWSVSGQRADWRLQPLS